MSELYIDVGNTFIKAARRAEGRWSVDFRGEIDDPDPFYRWLGSQDDPTITLCSVVQRITSRLESTFPQGSGRLEVLRTAQIPDAMLSYNTPETLGMDRFLACLGARSRSGSSVVVIDSGSACTVDYMTKESVFMGGVIMPGIELIRRAAADALEELPESDLLIPGEWPGKSTLDCLRWGVSGAFIEAIRGFLNRFASTYGTFDLFLSGGDAERIYHAISSEFHPVHDPHLLFDGMMAFKQLNVQ
ncbi:MAG: type III pantothenate kinase [Balneolaceae bacterium]